MNRGYIPICPKMYKSNDEAEMMRKYAEEPVFWQDVGDHPYLATRPLPCVRDENGEMREKTVKALLAKIDEELNELKEAVAILITFRDLYGDRQKLKKDDVCWISEEAADTITAITTMLETLGIDAEMRDEAQRRVNNKNRSRNRL